MADRTIRVLITEDERISAEDLRMRLTHLGYEVAGVCSSGEQVLAVLPECKPDILLMDIRLKGTLSGIETVEKIRQSYPVPVIYLTAYADKNTIQQIKKTEPYGLILKPFEDNELVGSIETAIYKHDTEMELERNRAWFRTALRSIGDAVITTDPSGTVTFMNPQAEQITGWKENEALGLPFGSVFQIAGSETGGKPALPDSVIRTRLTGRFKSEHPVEYRVSPILDENGLDLGLVFVFRDIAARLEEEIALQKSERFFREVVENAAGIPYRIVFGDRFGTSRYEYIGDGIESILGIPKEEFLESRFHNSIDQFIPLDPDMGPDPRACREQLIRGDLNQYRADIRIHTPSGKTVWLTDRSLPLKDKESGAVVGSIGILYEITSQKLRDEENDRLLAILEATPDIISTADSCRNITYLNRAGKDIMGWSDKSLAEKRIEHLHPASSLKIIETLGIPGAVKNRVWRGETSIRAADGQEIPVSQIIMCHEPASVSPRYFSTIMRIL